MWDLILENVEAPSEERKNNRIPTLNTWFHLLNFATLAIVCLIFMKIYRGLSLVGRWLFPPQETFENPIILVVGPETPIIRSIIRRLSRKFNSEPIDLEKIMRTTPGPLNPSSKIPKTILLYTHVPITDHSVIKDVSDYVEKAYNQLDILVIAQNESIIDRESTQTFLTTLNRQLLQQFWTVMAFLPGMLRKNRGHIYSLELDGSTSVNTGVIRTIHEDLQQSDTKVKLTLMERNTFLESFLPSLSTDTLARFIVESMWTGNSVVRVPSLSSCLYTLPKSVIRFLMRPILKVSNLNLT